MKKLGSLFYSPEDLSNALTTGDTAKVKKCLDYGLSPNYCTRAFGTRVWTTILDIAILKDNTSMVQLLLRYNADITGTVARDKAIIAQAAQSTTSPDQWSTAFHLAANKENESMLKILIEQSNADVNVCDCAGTTPLHLAVSKGRTNIVQFLLEHGACVDALNGKVATPLHLAAGEGKHEIAQLLLNYGAPLDLRDFAGRTALMYAVSKQHSKVTELLASNEADLEAHDNNDFTAFFSAASKFDITMMEILADVGADIEARDRNGCTALIRAVMAKNEALVDSLLKLGISIDTRDSDGWTALYAAMVNDDNDVADTLLDNGAAIQNINKNDGNSLFHDAAKTGCAFVTRYLLAHATDPNKRNERQETPLHLASTHGHRNIVHLLLANKTTDPSPEDFAGKTPLHCAAASGYFAIVKELVTAGAKIDLPSTRTETPIIEAAQNNHIRITHYLESCGARLPKDSMHKLSGDPPPYEMPTDTSRMRSKQGKKVPSILNVAEEAKESEDPFEASIPIPAPLYPDSIILKHADGTEALKAGIEVANARLNLVGTLLGG